MGLGDLGLGLGLLFIPFLSISSLSIDINAVARGVDFALFFIIGFVFGKGFQKRLFIYGLCF